MKRLLGTLGVVAAGLLIGNSLVYGKATTGVAIFNYSSGARQLGMADTAVGLADDANAIYYNPAGMATVRRLELNAMYFDNIVDTKDEAISVVNPLRRGLLGGKAAFGAGLKAYQGGDMEVIMIDAGGNETRHETISAESDYMGIIGYAEEIMPNICLGLAIKGIRSTLVEEYNATAYAIDLGMLYHTPIQGLDAGICMQNNGSEMKFIEEGDSLPTRYAAGVGYTMYPLSMLQVKAGLDYMQEREIDAATNVGLELTMMNMITLRGGYYTKSDLGSATMGLGVKVGMIQLDYGYGMMDELGNLQRASITMRWGGTSDNEPNKMQKKQVEKKNPAKKADTKKAIKKTTAAKRYSLTK